MAIGLPFLPFLTRDEFKSMLAHEMAHFTGRDTQFSIRVAPIHKSLEIITEEIRYLKENNFITYLILWPPQLILSLFLRHVSSLFATLSREREKRADFIATLLYGKENFVRSLTKISNISVAFINRENNDFLDKNTANHPMVNYNRFFVDHFDSSLLMDDKINQEETGLFDSHCSNKDRIDYVPDHEIPIINEYFTQDKLESYEKNLTDLKMAYYNEIRPYCYASNKINLDSESTEENGQSSLAVSDSEPVLSEKILFNAKYGFFKSRHLQLTETAIVYNKTIIPYTSIVAYLMYETMENFSLGPHYYISLKTESQKKLFHIPLKNETMFDDLLLLMGDYVSRLIYTSWLKTIQKGESIRFATLTITNDYLEMPRKSVWGASSKNDRVPWQDVDYEMINRTLTIRSVDNTNQVTYSTNNVDNLWVLWDFLNIFYQNGDGEHLTSIIE